MTPELALATIPGFSNATLSIMLADGPTSTTMLLEHFEAKYVLKIDKPSARELGMDRHAEEVICRMVTAVGLAPELVYIDHSRGISLRRFVSGTNWLESDLRKSSWLKRLAPLLIKLHSLPAVESQFEPETAITSYAQYLGTAQAKELAEKALQLLAKSRQLQDRSCLCHNDLLNHNILESDKVMLIDWEFAGMGDPWFDLAIVVQHHGLGEKLGKLFLTAYLQRKPTAKELDRLWANCEFYASLLELWELRLENS
ncbi:MAG: thiamine kinase [Lysobacterales bacterium]|jgi:thiamine kinase